MAGFNGTVFAYGQTGSGKTFTVHGPLDAVAKKGELCAEAGVLPRALEYVFARVKEVEKSSECPHTPSLPWVPIPPPPC